MKRTASSNVTFQTDHLFDDYCSKEICGTIDGDRESRLEDGRFCKHGTLADGLGLCRLRVFVLVALIACNVLLLDCNNLLNTFIYDAFLEKEK